MYICLICSGNTAAILLNQYSAYWITFNQWHQQGHKVPCSKRPSMGCPGTSTIHHVQTGKKKSSYSVPESSMALERTCVLKCLEVLIVPFVHKPFWLGQLQFSNGFLLMQPWLPLRELAMYKIWSNHQIKHLSSSVSKHITFLCMRWSYT